MNTKREFYVYVLSRPDGTPCYVGKGKGRRWMIHEWRSANQHLARIIAKAGGALDRVKVRENLTEAEAIETEIALIGALGRIKDGGGLVNSVLGGGGVSGLEHSSETKQRISEKLRGVPKSEETKRRMSAAQKGRPVSAATRLKRSEALKGKPGRHCAPHSPEAKEKMRMATLARFSDVAEREKARHRTIEQFADVGKRERHHAAMLRWGSDPNVQKMLSDAHTRPKA